MTPGVVYTPADLADRLARAVVDPMIAVRGERIRVVDFACGDGALLRAAARRLAAHGLSPSGRLFGMDVDPIARQAADVATIRIGDGLSADLGTFDAILLNPPWVDAEVHARADPDGRAAITAKFPCARGNWDLFVPFVERTWSLCPAGRVGILLPERALSSDYMAEVHRGWLRRRPLACWRLGRAFSSVGVDAIAWIDEAGAGDTMDFDGRTVPISALERLPPGHWGGASALSDGELRRLAGPKLGDLASLSDGASTSEAYRLAELLREDGDFKLVNTGTIDPFRLRWGEKEIRYLGRRMLRPTVSAADLARFPLRIRQARTEKVVVAGLARRLEAAYAGPDVLCGKSAVCVIPRGRPHAVAAVLNSRPIGSLYARLFGAHGFTGSLHVGPRQLERLPFPELTSDLDDLGVHLSTSPTDAQALASLDARIEAWLSE